MPSPAITTLVSFLASSLEGKVYRDLLIYDRTSRGGNDPRYGPT